MNNSAKVIGNKTTGLAITMKSITDKNGVKRQVGSVMVQSKEASFGKGSFGRMSVRTAFITLEQDYLDEFENQIIVGEDFPSLGKIVVNETLTPYVFKSGPKKGQSQEPKTRGKNGSVMLHNGSPIYRNTFFTTNMDEADILLSADDENSSEEAAE